MQTLFKRGAFMVTRTQFGVPRAFFADGPLKDKERAAEKMFFDKEERKTMAKLLKKLQIQEEGGDPDIDAVKVATPKDSQSLKSVLAKHNVRASDALVQDILAWKRQDSD